MYPGFREQVKRFNEAYGVESNDDPVNLGFQRLENFQRIFCDELHEIHEINGDPTESLEGKVALADWLTDLYVYVASEARRWGVTDMLPVLKPGYSYPFKLERFYFATGVSVLAIEQPLDLAWKLPQLAGEIAYCANRYGVDLTITLPIIMRSNFSKMGADGKPIVDETGKIRKGPNFKPPEPELRELYRGEFQGDV